MPISRASVSAPREAIAGTPPPRTTTVTLSAIAAARPTTAVFDRHFTTATPSSHTATIGIVRVDARDCRYTVARPNATARTVAARRTGKDRAATASPMVPPAPTAISSPSSG